MENNFMPYIGKKWHLFLLIGIVSILLIVSGYFIYSFQKEEIEKEKHSDIKVISVLKINEIQNWIKERTANITVISQSKFFIEKIKESINNDDKSLKVKIAEYINSIKTQYDYENIFICSVDGDTIISTSTDEGAFDISTLSRIKFAVLKKQITYTDFYFCNSHKILHLDFIAPVIDANKVIAVLVFRISPVDYLFPLIQSWPTPSRTSETLLIRRDGDSVLFLNELRHTKNTALKLRISLQDTAVPAVQAVLGRRGVFEGLDYRNEKVLSYLSEIPGTSWFMVAKVDKDEVYTELYFRTGMIIAFVAVLIIGASFGFFWLYHYRQRNIYRELYNTNEEFKTTLHSIGDAVITTDKKGKVKYLNPVAEELTGWNVKDAYSKELEKVFNIISEETSNKVENPVNRVLREGLIVGLANHTLLISKDGSEIPIADSGAPIRNDKGDIIGVVLVFRDQTDEREFQRKIIHQNAILNAIINNSHSILIFMVDKNYCYVNFNENHKKEMKRIFNIDIEVGMNILDCINIHEYKDALKINFDRVLSGDSFVEIQYEQNEEKYYELHWNQVRKPDDEIYAISCFAINITERKKTEEALKESELKLRNIFEHSSDLFYSHDTNHVLHYFSPQVKKILGYEVEEALIKWTEFTSDNPINEIGYQKTVKAIETGIAQEPYELELIQKNGNKIWVEVREAPVVENGKTVSIVGSLTDITERKLTAEKLRESEERFRCLFENNHTTILVIDSITGKIEDVNQAAVNYYGWSREKLKTMYISEINTLSPEQIKIEMEAAASAKRNHFFFKHRKADGTIRDVEVFSGPIIIKNKKFLYSIVHDITEQKQAEENLKKSEEKIQSIFKTAPVGIGVVVKRIFTEVNLYLCEMLGYTREEFLGNSARMIYPSQEEFDYVGKEKYQQFAIKGIGTVETRFKCKNGKIINIILSSTPIDISDHQKGVIFTALDITDRKKAEETIQADRILLRAIIDNLPDAIYAKDTNFRKTLANKADLENMGGFREEEVIGKTDYDFFPKEDADKFFEDDKKTINTGKAILNKEESFVDKSGNTRWLLTSKLPLRNDKGEIVGLLGIGRDITERKKSELKLIENENRFRSISKTANDAIIVANTKGHIVYWNQSAVRIFGYNINEILTKPLDVIIPEKYREAHHIGMERFAFTKIPNIIGKNVELVGLRKDGVEFPIELSLASWETSEGQFYSAIIHDITDRKRQQEELIKAKEKAEKADQLKSEFLAQMSHEIRTPINVILSFNNLLKDEVEGKVDTELYKMFDSVEFSSSRIIRTIDMILNMSELQTETYEPTYSNIDIQNDVLNRLINEYQNKAKSKGLRLLYNYKAKDMNLKADEYSVIQIFANLLDNAIKYTDNGKVEIIVDRNKENKLEVVVVDTGIGISEEYLPYLFEPFSQEDHGYSRRFEGNGLGLALVKRYCEINNAYITVETKKGAGSKFTVVFNEV